MDAGRLLAAATLFEFPYWDTHSEYQCLTVVRGWKRGTNRDYSSHWAVVDGRSGGLDGSGPGWTGEDFDFNVRGHDLYRWTLDEAVDIAQRLVLELNAGIIDQMEGRFPGEFRGGPYDMNRKSGT